VTGWVIWFTGLPSSGKSTMAERVAAQLEGSIILDGDAVRAALSPPPGYDDEARTHFYQTLASLAALLAGQGHVVLVPATAHRRVYREKARQLAPHFLEVHVATPAAACAERDAKGLYRASAEGEVSELPGAGADYEVPASPDITAAGGEDAEAIAAIGRLVGRP